MSDISSVTGRTATVATVDGQPANAREVQRWLDTHAEPSDGTAELRERIEAEWYNGNLADDVRDRLLAPSGETCGHGVRVCTRCADRTGAEWDPRVSGAPGQTDPAFRQP